MVCQSHVHGNHEHKNDHIDHNHSRITTQNVSVAQNKTALTSTISSNGHQCGTPDPTPEEMTMVNNLLSKVTLSSFSSADTIVVNTYFHIITDGANGQLTVRQISDQMDVLNDRFASMGVSFILQGYDKTNNPNWYNNCGSNKMVAEFPACIEIKRALRQGGLTDLNVYWVNIPTDQLGFSWLPWQKISPDVPTYDPQLDGVMVKSTTIVGGTEPNYNLGIILVHEVGHWLGLLHTFNGWDDTTGTGGCNLNGDFVGDTPAEDRPAIFTPNGAPCSKGRNTCTGPDFPGDDVSTLYFFPL